MWSCDYFGRKVNIQLGAFFSVLGGALQGGAANLAYVVLHPHPALVTAF